MYLITYVKDISMMVKEDQKYAVDNLHGLGSVFRIVLELHKDDTLIGVKNLYLMIRILVFNRVVIILCF